MAAWPIFTSIGILILMLALRCLMKGGSKGGARRILMSIGILTVLFGVVGISAWYLAYEIPADEARVRDSWHTTDMLKDVRDRGMRDMARWDLIVGGIGLILLVTGALVPERSIEQ